MQNRFEQFHPLVVFGYYAGFLTLLILMLHPVFLITALLVILAVNMLQGSLRVLNRWIFFMISTGLFFVFFNPLFNERGRHVLFEIHQHRFTLEAFVYGGISAVSIIGVIALFASYNEVMTPNKLLFLFSKFLPQFAVLLMLTLRFVPLMRRRLDEISAVQRSKGISVLHGKWSNRVKTGMLYVQVLLTHSLEEAIQTADSMKARGYGEKDRSAYEYFLFRKADLWALIYLIIFIIPVLAGRFYGYGFLTVYPLMESWKFSSADSFVYSSYLLFIIFPLIAELGGYIRWRL